MTKSQRDLFVSLRLSISHERLEAYRREDDDGTVLTRYLWNTMLSESLYPILQYLEVALRNSIHTSVSTAYNRNDWYNIMPSVLEPQQRDMVLDAMRKLRDAHKPLTPGRIVAELTFGFWTSLFNRPYEAPPSGDPRLWPRLLAPVFPGMPRRIRTRRTLSRQLNDVRTLRNRVFHHEPIWHYPGLARQHDELLNLVRWINPDMYEAIRLLDRFLNVAANGYDQCHTLLAGLITP